MTDFSQITSHFCINGFVQSITPLGNGLINETLKVETTDRKNPCYVLQRINTEVFKDVELLQHNIEVVTEHIRKKLQQKGVRDIERRVLRFIPSVYDGKTYYRCFDGSCWRMSAFIPNAYSYDVVDTHFSELAGRAFGEFEAMLSDVDGQLGETIPNFHNMEYRLAQLAEAMKNDVDGRLQEVRTLVDDINRDAKSMCFAEELHRQGLLPKRICHCDTKVNNMLFDDNGNVLCVIDLDTVMSSYVFSDYGDFLRTAANYVGEDSPDLSRVGFNMEIFKAFTRGYLHSASSFLTKVEIDNLPRAAAMFPYMQCVRFLTDYLNGDTYYKIKYPTHNLVRARNQYALYKDVCSKTDEMRQYISSLL